MPANKNQLQAALQKPYDRILFAQEVLKPVFGSGFVLNSTLVPATEQPNKTEKTVIDSVYVYGTINLEDETEITCYEITLQPTVHIEHSKVAIQRYVRKLLTAGQIALVNFVAPQNKKKVWRLTLVAKDSKLTEQGIKEKTTHAKRYTYLLGPSETCRTVAERFESLSTEKQITFQSLVNAFSVEKLSKVFFDEYTLHYQRFCEYLQESSFRKSAFKLSFPANATQEEKDKASKPIRDFVKKLLGRIVFLYFVQKKGWLGASDTNYKDGLTDFIKQLFTLSGGNDAFYNNQLKNLFFDTLNTGESKRPNEDFIMPDGKKVKVPFLNGGLFDKEAYDDAVLTLPANLFHHADFEDTALTAKTRDNSRGFLDFLDAFNFTVHEDSLDDHTVAVDPEMLGHIFENLLEDNKDKGAFYTPKEIVHYMCQESLAEYLTTQLKIENEKLKNGIAEMVKRKEISNEVKPLLAEIDQKLDTVKICDPAIGSGAFPMGLLQEIHTIKEVIAYETNKTWKPAEVKENIIQNSIYGVDIEKGAVDIARLRFWLSLVVDEEKPRALPNLDYKIVVGDSLVSKFEGEIIEIDWNKKSSVGKADAYVKNVQQLLKDIAEKQKQFFKPDNKDKKKLQAEIRDLKLELLINQLSYNKAAYENKTPVLGGFAPTAKEIKHNTERELTVKGFKENIERLKHLKKNKEQPFEHFDWKLDFPEVLNPLLKENGGLNSAVGFDIIIGNPPYVNVENLSDELKQYLFENYETCKGRTDIYIAFLEKALSLLKDNQTYSFIIPYAFTNQNYGSLLRKKLIEKYFIKEILDTSEYYVFENAVVKNIILRIQKTENKERTTIKVVESGRDFQNNEFQTSTLNQKVFLDLKDFRFETKNISNFLSLKNKIINDTIRLDKICLIAYGARLNHKTEKIGKENYIFSEFKKEYKPFTEGKNIERFTFTQYGWLKYKPDEHYNPMFPEVFENDKIIFIRVVKDRLRFAFDSNHFYNSHTVINCVKWNLLQKAEHSTVKRNITAEKIKNGNDFEYMFLLGVLNSTLINWYFLNFLSDALNFYPDDAKELPIPIVGKEKQQFIISLSTKILSTKKSNPNSDTSKLEREIDIRAYHLYNLNFKEAKLIDKTLTEKEFQKFK